MLICVLKIELIDSKVQLKFDLNSNIYKDNIHMLPQNISEVEPADQTAERQTNYLILRTLESKLDPDLFRTLLNSVSQFSSNLYRSSLKWTCRSM